MTQQDLKVTNPLVLGLGIGAGTVAMLKALEWGSAGWYWLSKDEHLLKLMEGFAVIVAKTKDIEELN